MSDLSAMKPLPQPWLPPVYTIDDVIAVEAVAKGIASAEQQKRAMDYVIHRACGTYDQTYFADSERNSTFAQGKRNVGLHLVTLINEAPNLQRQLRADAQSPSKPRGTGK